MDIRGLKNKVRAAVATAALTTTPFLAASAAEADLVLKGGTIYTGTDAPFVGDVAISGDRISYVGKKAPGDAGRVIDAKGLIIAPGFIDTHTHVNGMLGGDDATERLVLPFMMQGVTTAFIGNDGYGDPDTGRLLGAAATRPVGINYATYVGFGAVRSKVIGQDDRAPTAAELSEMKQLVASAMCSGALGFSTGLFYAPQSFAKQDEVIALAKEAAIRGGIYDSHIRDESSYTIGLSVAIDEAITVGREAGMPAHIGHIKALGVDVHGQAPAIIAKIEAARAAGQIVHADQYPWSASGTGLSASLLPRWAEDGGRAAMLKRFDEPETLARIRPEMRENLRRRGGAASLLITSGPDDLVGKTLEAIAKESGAEPIDAAIAILRRAQVGVASFNQSEADIAAFMKQPWVMTSSDGSIGHPRLYGTYARKYAKYVKADKVISLRDFIERSTALPSSAFSLEGRGTLKPGGFADVIAFDPVTFAPRADYAQPTLFAKGIRTVIVNGRVAVEDGAPTGIAAGRALARTPKAGTCL
ncbi:N-acyl-D-amino-acid deacylase family protein [Sphingosinicella microcystinivorans]|uniref:Dihydroorotase n=1 Tax=Sphingosinicella microcystinivorans TaxID=335406 RepID=A0AAD1D5R5_SPHMI|nr:amidohydrolase family protein [Sphingosinicella microcystinivorans]RKS91043.1 N-acyl-D-aspartate/D-glutamate deacylase [Sphingosinicella microcystinivorans]BBE33964.1 dihydroorotase [Sphingosinicella microcystinivorans]